MVSLTDLTTNFVMEFDSCFGYGMIKLFQPLDFKDRKLAHCWKSCSSDKIYWIYSKNRSIPDIFLGRTCQLWLHKL